MSPSAPADAAAPRKGSFGTHGRRSILSTLLIHLIVAFLLLILVQHALVRIYQVPSSSMKPTLNPSDRVLASVWSSREPEVGDVVVFTHGQDWEQARLPNSGDPLKEAARTAGDIFGFGPSHYRSTVKRIIAGPGQTVECCSVDGTILVDGYPLEEPYLRQDLPFAPGTLDCGVGKQISQRCFPPVTVPERSYLVLGDDRGASEDSVTACRGVTQENAESTDCAVFVPAEHVVGTVIWKVWPLSAFGAV